MDNAHKNPKPRNLDALYPRDSHNPFGPEALGAPNLRVAQALLSFNPTLAYRVLDCWRPPFNRPCERFRFCAACAGYRRRTRRQTNERRLASMATPFFLTLTAPCGRTLRRCHIDRFRKRFTSLRRWRRFVRCVRGGFYVIEIKLGEDEPRLWNIHAHVILDLADLTLDKIEIKKAWHRRTGGYMVEFVPIKAGTLATVLHYMGKPQDLPVSIATGTAIAALTRKQDAPLDPVRVRELHLAAKGFTDSNTFGSFNKKSRKYATNRRDPGAA